VCVGERTTALNCQQLRFYCAKMHLCIFLMAQFRTKTNDIGKNNIAWSTAVEGGWLGRIVGWLGGWVAGRRIARSVGVAGHGWLQENQQLR